MGYDMTIEATPAEEVAATRVAEAAFYAAIKERGALPRESPDYDAAQEKVDEAMEAMRAADTSYFRLNVWGMSRFREFMEQLGMVAVDYEVPDFPDRPDGITWEDVESAEAEPDDGTDLPVKAEALAYAKARETHLAWHPQPAFGIALHKFGSNDGWLVTPGEIESALESYRTHDAAEVKTLVGDDLASWVRWIEYLTRAQGRGGFRVW